MLTFPAMTDVKSSNVEAVGYHKGELHVRFKGGSHYVYLNVPSSVHAKMMAADSVGAHLAEHIKDKFDFRKLK